MLFLQRGRNGRKVHLAGHCSQSNKWVSEINPGNVRLKCLLVKGFRDYPLQLTLLAGFSEIYKAFHISKTTFICYAHLVNNLHY